MKTVSKKLLSLLLVAFLLVSALPFQAFAAELGTQETADAPVTTDAPVTADVIPYEAPVTAADTTPGEGDVTAQGGGAVVHDPELHSSFVAEWITGTRTHSLRCTVSGCPYPGATEPCEFDGSHLCKICHHQYEGHDYQVDPANPGRAPTCTENGATEVKICTMCGDRIGGDMIPSLGGHNYVGGVCQNCGDIQAETKTIILHAGEGHTFANGYTTRGFSLMVGQDIPISELSAPVDTKGEFLGWFIKGTEIPLDTSRPYDGTWTELEAKWKTTTYEVTFYRILNNQLSTASLITKVNLTPNTRLDTYVESSGILTNEKVTHPGYHLVINSQDYPVKKYVNGVFSPVSSTDVAESLRTVYINLTPDTFTLTLNANGGTVNPSSISGIAYGTTVTLPTPTKVKSVFQGWKDTDGNIYKGSMVYQFTSNATLTAVWDSEATVMLRIFINGDFSAPDRIVELTGYISGSKVIRLTSDGSGTPDVTSIIQKYYVSNNGYALNVRGLFKEADWESFKANTSLSGDPIVTVDKSTTINVMVYNAAQNNGSSSGSNLPTSVPNNGNAYWMVTGKNTGYWVYTNGSASSLPTGAYWGGSYHIYDPYNYLSNSNSGSGSSANIPTTVPNNGNAYWLVTGKNTGYWVYTNGSASSLPTGAYWSGKCYIYDPYNYLSGSNSNPDLPTSVPNNGNAYWVVTGKATGYWVYTNGTSSSLPAGAYWGGSYYIYDPNNILGNNNNNGSIIIIPTYPNNSNPKTGDTAKLEIAASVMVLAAAGLIIVMALRKKKSV